jgi:predicted DNA-binding transcriptional regulator YafY
VRHTRVRGGYEYEDPTYALPSVFLEEGELLALLLAEEVARSYVGTALEEPLQRALAKLRRYLPDTITVNLDEAAAAYHFRELSRLEAPLERMRDLQRAVRERRVVWIRYRSPRADAETEREIEPHFFAHVGGDCMLVAWDRLRDAVRAFLPGRILDHAVREARFRRRPELSAETYSASAFLTEHGDQPFEVVLRFDAYQARWIRERRWHPSQVLEELPDGGVLMRLRVSGDGDLLRWVLGYGSHVEIVSPAWLRDRAVAELEATLALYRRAGAEQLTER